MKISLNWLKDYVSFNILPEKLSHQLTMAGSEVKKIASVNDDTLFELEITPNRPDCLNMLGLARETAAILNKTCRFPSLKKINFPKEKADITIEDKKGCLCYLGTVIENAAVRPAPEQIKKRLEALGMRGINNIVDITNFCLLETGQPLHAFDYDKLAGGKIVVRRAKKGERIVTIDGVERGLDENILVIADQERPVAIAGIMGGKDTEVTASTKNILLESAYFDPILIRRGSRQLGLSSESSYRFERGVDYPAVETGLNRAISLILQSARGTITKHAKVTYFKEKPAAKIRISREEIVAYLGAHLTASQCRNILGKLGFKVTAKGGGILEVLAPSFRSDIKQAVDLIEEIARISGYEKIPLTVPEVKIAGIYPPPQKKFRIFLRDMLLAQGFNEVITYAMVNQKVLAKSNLGSLQGIKIQNPLTQDQEMMRPSFIPGLLAAVALNFNRGEKDLKLFELAKIYLPSQGEKEILGIVMSGSQILDWRKPKEGKIDFYDLKGALEIIFARLDIREFNFRSNDAPCFERGQRAGVFIAGKEAGRLGRVSGEVLDKWDIKSRDVFLAEVDVESFLSGLSGSRAFRPPVEFPAVVRDVSLDVTDTVAFEEVRKLAIRLGGPILSSIVFKEEYLGEKIPPGHRGLIFSLTYQSPERTLTEAEVTVIHEKILKSFKESLGAVIR